MTKTTSLKVIDETILGTGEDLPTSKVHKYRAINFPFLLESHSSIKILAKLDFVNDDVFKRETINSKLRYTMKILYANKKFEKIIGKEGTSYYREE